MSVLERRMAEDKALRDAALRLFRSDLALVREDLRDRPAGARIADRIGDATMDMLDDAVDYADENRGKVAAGAIAIVVWFARGPIVDALGRWLGRSADGAEPAGEPDRSDTD